MELNFDVPAVPVAQPRQRHRARMLNGHIITQNYTPTDSPVNSFKATVRHAAKAVYDGPPSEDPIYINLVFVMPRPKRLVWKTREMPREWWPSGKDLDNLEKSVLDALTGLIWKDDAQVCHKVSRKKVAAGDEQPHVEVNIQNLM